jgi:hypothetical protein
MKIIAGDPEPYFSTRSVPTVVTLAGFGRGLSVSVCARLTEKHERTKAERAIA